MLSYPAATTTGSIERAVALAAGLGAHIAGLTFEVDIRLPVGLYAHPPELGGILAAERKKSASNARDLLAAFDDICARQGTMGRAAGYEHALERCTPNEVATTLVHHARVRDLAIFPIAAADQERRALAEALMFESGRPVLLLPESGTRQLAASFGSAAVAWDHSRPAARAVADALPLLQTAKQVHVVTVVGEKRLHRPDSGVELCKHLARHGLEVTFDRLEAKGRAIGDALEAHALDRNVDLLVMGAYGHSKLREFVLGGATRSVLARPFAWTLVSH
ncbi:MAG TPA: universal stress protein [Hyphomicrobiaceae bacterium]|jgi:nucleotide-binding universal stress UspA family protein